MHWNHDGWIDGWMDGASVVKVGSSKGTKIL